MEHILQERKLLQEQRVVWPLVIPLDTKQYEHVDTLQMLTSFIKGKGEQEVDIV